ncbi:hypothetical protein G7Y89_g5815 [Cudoniella acicularis]|uniref:Uncharacterized protein n=1 Tax=Cudoniella acicularis TaxID=354080 RepID=A0A8H4RNE5_9HELO|nr:hypothetical protein G7Y89_g5815 [Cudoniella acicularis]
MTAPIPQGASVGEGCGETSSGLAVKEGLTNTAPLPKSAGAKRQGAGVGAILTDADTGSGLAVKEGIQNAASSAQSAGAKRQLDKFGAGTAAVISLASPNAATYQKGLTNNVDGGGTSDSAVIGQQVGALEVETGEGAGNIVPSKVGRQLDKVRAGTAAVVFLADPDAAAYQEGLTNNIEEGGTSDSAVVSEQVDALEVEAGEGSGNLVPSKLPAATLL